MLQDLKRKTKLNYNVYKIVMLIKNVAWYVEAISCNTRTYDIGKLSTPNIFISTFF